MKTTNGGVQWDKLFQLDSVFYEQIQFVTPKIGWICGGHGEVLKSIDGGLTWNKMSIPHPNPNVDLTLIYAMFFKNENDGFVGGGHLNYIIKNAKKYVNWDDGQYFILHTTDGGISWENIVRSPPVMLLTFQFLNDSIGFVSGDNSIYKTYDGGNSWQILFMDSTKSIGGIRGLWFMNFEHGYAASWNGYVLKTIDGGHTWERRRITKSPLRSMCFINDTIGYIVGNEGDTKTPIYVTKDGEDWQTFMTGLPDLHRIRRSDTFIWVCGKKGVILKGRLP
jgi:photosystem II stability/assembly factor-like uncharacterized protein